MRAIRRTFVCSDLVDEIDAVRRSDQPDRGVGTACYHNRPLFIARKRCARNVGIHVKRLYGDVAAAFRIPDLNHLIPCAICEGDRHGSGVAGHKSCRVYRVVHHNRRLDIGICVNRRCECDQDE